MSYPPNGHAIARPHRLSPFILTRNALTMVVVVVMVETTFYPISRISAWPRQRVLVIIDRSRETKGESEY